MSLEVWVVDDEPGILTMCSDYLVGTYKVASFSSPMQLLNQLESGLQPDVMMTDIKMPEMDGMRLTDLVRAHCPALPIVMMSGYADKSHILSGMEKGIFGFIEKPFDLRKMKQMLESAAKEARYLRSLEVLAIKYDTLTKTALDLNSDYVSRYVEAENLLFDLGCPKFVSKPEAQAFLNKIKKENILTRVIESLAAEIEGIWTQEAELAGRLELVSDEMMHSSQKKLIA